MKKENKQCNSLEESLPKKELEKNEEYNNSREFLLEKVLEENFTYFLDMYSDEYFDPFY